MSSTAPSTKQVERDEQITMEESEVSERVLGQFAIAARNILEGFEQRIGKTSVATCTEQAKEILESHNLEKITASDYVEIIKSVSNRYPVPTQESILVKTLILQGLAPKMLENINNVDPAPVIIANIDLSNEIRMVENNAKDQMTGMRTFKSRPVFEYMARINGATTKLYHHAFEYRNKEEIYLVEKAFAHLSAAYPKTKKTEVPFEHDRRSNVEGVISGIRAEAFAWIHLDSFFDSITSIPELKDETLEQKFPGVPANELRDMYFYIEEFVGLPDRKFDLIVKHAPNIVDVKGQADLCVYAVERESNKEKFLFLVDVKTAPVLDRGVETPIRYFGVSPVKNAEKTDSAPFPVGDHIWPPISRSAVDHAMVLEVPVLAVRIPNTWTRSQRKSPIARRELVTDIASGEKVEVPDISATLRTILKTKPEDANEEAVSTITGLLRNIG